MINWSKLNLDVFISNRMMNSNTERCCTSVPHSTTSEMFHHYSRLYQQQWLWWSDPSRLRLDHVLASLRTLRLPPKSTSKFSDFPLAVPSVRLCLLFVLLGLRFQFLQIQRALGLTSRSSDFSFSKFNKQVCGLSTSTSFGKCVLGFSARCSQVQ